jgi:hypothetical protein
MRKLTAGRLRSGGFHMGCEVLANGLECDGTTCAIAGGRDGFRDGCHFPMVVFHKIEVYRFGMLGGADDT